MITPEELAGIDLFAVLESSLRALIVSRSAEVRVGAGEFFTFEGSTPFLWTVLEGEVERVRMVNGHAEQMTTFDPGEYFGEVPIVMDTDSFATMRAIRPSRLMRTERSEFHLMLSESPEATAIVSTTIARRVQFIGAAYTQRQSWQATIVGNRADVACHGTRDFLSRNQIIFDWLDPENAVEAARIPPQARGITEGPIVLLADGTVLRAPNNRDLACALGLPVDPLAHHYDVVIVGGGPAGLAAAVYGGSEGLHTLLVEREAPGGQAGTSSRIENYLGFPAGISGGELANRALAQAKRFGVELLVTRTVDAVQSDGDGFTVTLDGGSVIRARAVVLTTGVTWREFDAEGASALVGRGIYYGAARTEAATVRGKDIFLIGGGNSAGQAAMFFANYARSVTLVIRGDGLERTMSKYLIDQLATKSNIAVETKTTVVRVRGEAALEAIVTHTDGQADDRERPTDALFAFIGADAQTAWLPAELERDGHGYICTGRDIRAWSQARQPFPLETSIPGIFAAGDVRSGSVKRVAAGVGEGSMVIAYIHAYIEAQHRGSGP
jgi:thioredoxin reductase (NADPH)